MLVLLGGGGANLVLLSDFQCFPLCPSNQTCHCFVHIAGLEMDQQHLLEEKEYQLRSDPSKSTIQLVDEEKQKMREEIESLRTQEVVQPKVEHGHKEDVNRTGIKTDDAMVTLPYGMHIISLIPRLSRGGEESLVSAHAFDHNDIPSFAYTLKR